MAPRLSQAVVIPVVLLALAGAPPGADAELNLHPDGGEFKPVYCIDHASVAWSSCEGLVPDGAIIWDPSEAVPMHDPTGADAAMVKGPLGAIKRATETCKIASRRHACGASWVSCVPSITPEEIAKSGDVYSYRQFHLPALKINSEEEKKRITRTVPRALCTRMRDACTDAELEDARGEFFKLLHTFRMLTHRSDAESHALADMYFAPDCSDDTVYGDREHEQPICTVTLATMPEPPLRTKDGPPEPPPGAPLCAHDVEGEGCCTAEQQAMLEDGLRGLLRGYGTDQIVTESKCALQLRSLLCQAGCGYDQQDGVSVDEDEDGTPQLSVRLGANFCEMLHRDCACELSAQSGTALGAAFNSSLEICAHGAQALLPLARSARPELGARVKVTITDPNGPLGPAATVLAGEMLKQTCEQTQVEAYLSDEGDPTPELERCTTHGAPHGPVTVSGAGGECRHFFGPGETTCCDGEHMSTLDSNLALLGGILHNPTCGHEFAKLACTTLCSPSQHLFARTSYPKTNRDGSLNVTIRVSEDWCEDIVAACKDETDPRDNKKFSEKFSDSTAMCSLIGPYLNMMLEPGPHTPRYKFEPHSHYDETTPGDLMLSQQRCVDVPECDAPKDACPLGTEGRAPYDWLAGAQLGGGGDDDDDDEAEALAQLEGSVCAAHADASCCTPAEAARLADWAEAPTSAFGKALAAAGGACAANVTAAMCGIGCSDRQATFVDPAESESDSQHVFVLPAACERMLGACGGAGALEEHGVTDGASFCHALAAVFADVAPGRAPPKTAHHQLSGSSSDGGGGGGRRSRRSRSRERAASTVQVSVAVAPSKPAPTIEAGVGRPPRRQFGRSLVPGLANAAEVGKTCPLSDDEPIHAVAAPGLELCKQHNEAACCYAESEHMLSSKLQLLKRNFGGGSSECLPAVLALTCASACSPRQSYFVWVQRDAHGVPVPLPDGSLNASYYLSPSYCDGLYAKCRGAYSEIFGDTLGNLYPTAVQFCEAFSVTSDPTYKPGPGKATLMARVGANPDTGLAIGDTMLPGGPLPEPVPDLEGTLDSAPQAACLQVEAKPRPLNFCSQYREMSCCEVDLEVTIGGNLTAVASPIFGKGCCFERLSELVCGLACSPHQADYMSNVTANADGSFNVTIYVDPAMADALWHDCASHKMLATTTVETYFEDAEELLEKIASGVKTKEVAQLRILVGKNPFSKMGVGAADAQTTCTDPPPLSELAIGFDTLPTEPLRHPGRIPMYLLIFACILAAAFGVALCACGSAAPAAASPAEHAAGGAGSSGSSSDAPSKPGSPVLGPSAGAGGVDVLPSDAAYGEGVATALYERIEEAYYTLGHFTAAHPVYALVLLAIALTWSFGQLGNLSLETKPTELWVAQGTPSVWQADFTAERFGQQRHEVMIITTMEPGGDVLFPAALDEAADVEEELRSLQYTKDGATATLGEVCSRVQCRNPAANESTTCVFQSPLKYWPRRAYRTDDDLYATVSNLAAKDECGIPILRKTVLGGLESDGHGRVLRARSLMIAILLERKPFEKARAYEYGFLDVAERANARAQHVQVSYMAQVSQDEEVARLASADVPLLAMSYVMMIMYVVFAMSGTQRTSSHVLLGLTGVALVICSIIIMLGLTVLLRVPFTPVSTQVLPFLLLGIGVDNIFILSNTYIARIREPRTRVLTPAQLVGSILAQVGPTITLTSTATTLAFAVGSLSVMPAVKYFCQQCVLGFAVNLALQLTVFGAAIAADARRVRASKLDCMPCLTPCVGGLLDRRGAGAAEGAADAHARAEGGGGHPPAPREEGAHGGGNGHESPSGNGAGGGGGGAKPSAANGRAPSAHAPPRRHRRPSHVRELMKPRDDDVPGDELSRWLSTTYVTWLNRPSTRWGVLLAFGVLFLGALSHALNVAQGLEIGEVLPKGSYMATFFERFEFYSDIGPPVYITTAKRGADPDDAPGPRVDFSSHETQDVLGELVRALELSPWIKPPALDWLGDFQKWALVVSNHTQEVIDAEGRVPVDKFYPWLREFLAPGSDFAFYANYLSFCPRTGRLDAAQVMGFHVPLQSTDEFVQAMLDMRALCEPFADKTGVSIFPYSEYHVFYEQYAILVPNASKLLFSAIVVILCVMSLLLGNMLLSLPVLLLLVLNQIDLIGVMQLANVHMNGISIINLVMAIGLSVEYLAHVASTYNMAEGDHVQKLRKCMSSVGSSVVSGGITTLLGVLVLAFAKYPVFQVYYFRMYLATVLCGSLHGLVLLPVVLGFMQSIRSRRGAAGADSQRESRKPKANNGEGAASPDGTYAEML